MQRTQGRAVPTSTGRVAFAVTTLDFDPHEEARGMTVTSSYSRADMEVVDWLKRMRLCFAPFGQRGSLDPWDAK